MWLQLCAAILERAVSAQLKRGLGQEYVNRTEARSSLRGKIEVTDSVKSQAILRRQLVCSYDEFSVDTTMNRIIKATVALLVRSDISKARKKSLKKLMVFFADVRDIDLHHRRTGTCGYPPQQSHVPHAHGGVRLCRQGVCSKLKATAPRA